MGMFLVLTFCLVSYKVGFSLFFSGMTKRSCDLPWRCKHDRFANVFTAGVRCALEFRARGSAVLLSYNPVRGECDRVS